MDNEIDRKIDVTAILFLLVQNRQQTHDWTLIGSGADGLGIVECQGFYKQKTEITNIYKELYYIDLKVWKGAEYLFLFKIPKKGMIVIFTEKLEELIKYINFF